MIYKENHRRHFK